MAGYVTDEFEHVAVSGKGRAPMFWYGTTLPDGGATPWASAPIGALYMFKANESAAAILYFKVAVAETDDDWAAFSFVRIYSGSPMGLLLALTHK